MKSISLYTSLLLATTAIPAFAVNLITNPSFEDISGLEIVLDQGYLPTNWTNISGIGQGADTYSLDGTYGLSMGGFGHFTEVAGPADGNRFVAGGYFGEGVSEDFGQQLSLSSGTSYVLSAYLVLDYLYASGDTFKFFIRDDDQVLPDVVLGVFTPPESSTMWEFRTIEFTAPLNADQYEWIGFRPDVAYPGIDNLSLVAVPEPATAALGMAGLALVYVMANRSRKRE
ncbi:MAG: hypothetical protein SFY80_09885 [Verrucomicrobiota bacterium]|nr:hypothetical protein [Verrucomicrobiota bacterium]